MTDHLSREAARLHALASDMAERLAALEARADRAADFGIPGPSLLELRAARRLADEARAAAQGAARGLAA